MTEAEEIRQLADSLFDGVVQIDSVGRITLWNHGAERITGLSASRLIGKFYQKQIVHYNESGNHLPDECKPILQTLNDGTQREVLLHLKHADGFRVSVVARTLPILEKSGRITSAIQIFNDNKATIAAFQSARRTDETVLLDPLTGIGNRPHIETKIRSALDDLRQKNIRFGILFVDIDHFKDFNDAHGHLVGDKILRIVANTLRQNLRVTDSCGRWGGEEFLALVLGLDMDGLWTVAEKLRTTILQTRVKDDQLSLNVTISIGATLARPEDTLQSLIERADKLMYKSKQGGRNLVTIGE
ncbi:MAG: diguanylate cyclase [Chloroflexi bacterium]|nr:diguanylate cyclase [Chloroflexota bacterium]